jgi:hypothetical protein
LFLSSTSSILDRKGKVNNMDNRETPAEYKDKFMLSFVEMGWADPTMVDPRYKGWTGGRVEIHTYAGNDIDQQVKIFATIPLPTKIHERELDKTDIPGTFNAGATPRPGERNEHG